MPTYAFMHMSFEAMGLHFKFELAMYSASTR